MAKRTYNTLGRRILAILAIGGARKFNVFRWLADDKRLVATFQRLIDAKLIVRRRRAGGVHYALTKSKS